VEADRWTEVTPEVRRCLVVSSRIAKEANPNLQGKAKVRKSDEQERIYLPSKEVVKKSECEKLIPSRN
jgi:hypothetical protein